MLRLHGNKIVVNKVSSLNLVKTKIRGGVGAALHSSGFPHSLFITASRCRSTTPGLVSAADAGERSLCMP